MANWKLIGGITACVLVIGGIGSACNGKTNSGSSALSSTPTATASASSGKNSGKTKTVPNLVGKGLQSAQDAAQAAGFYNLASHDALGRARHQILDRDWKVCSQKPAAGTNTSTDAKLDFGAVKLDETCPAHDQKAPTTVGGKMPDFTGKSVAAARNALNSSTSLTVNDASSGDRMVLIESNWKVCTQKPAAGAALSGQPVTLDAVKFGESCP
ncbi:PASTA domain-containing protein [Streptomyces sp. NBC_01613]|uniref:PASTA domain-containing protein n=1 Tax=Streptomyces sp. NBC_01613 TaxID=2975896 RepID=UPI0038642244